MNQIIFNGPMVTAVNTGDKTQTRRIIKPQPKDSADFFTLCVNGGRFAYIGSNGEIVRARYKTGDALYVRETWAEVLDPPDTAGIRSFRYVYRADGDGMYAFKPKWRSARYMPKKAVRVFIRVTDTRIERLHDISYADCIKEGIKPNSVGDGALEFAARRDYAALWDSLNGKRDGGIYVWARNPWVEVVDFEVLDGRQLTALNNNIDRAS